MAVPPLALLPLEGRLRRPFGQKPVPQKDQFRACGFLPLPIACEQPWCGYQQQPLGNSLRTPPFSYPFSLLPCDFLTPRDWLSIWCTEKTLVESQSDLITTGGTKVLDQFLKLPNGYEKQRGGERIHSYLAALRFILIVS